jgi:hypothetical protein
MKHQPARCSFHLVPFPARRLSEELKLSAEYYGLKWHLDETVKTVA